MVRRSVLKGAALFALVKGFSMRKMIWAAAMLAASAAATPAWAQDDAFTGPWVGGTFGYDSFSAGGDGDDAEDGIAYGIALGYDVDVGGVVLGVEAELAESSVKASQSSVLEDGDEMTLSAGRDLYAGVRIGVPVTGNVMIFAKGGYTNQRFKLTYALDDEVESGHETLDGWRIGGGAEFDFGQPFARIEYRYSDYGAFSDAGFQTGRHQLVATAGLRF
jgi:outer membrane immunogenic protein